LGSRAGPPYLAPVGLAAHAPLGSLAPGLSPARLDDLKIAVSEACSNAIEAHEAATVLEDPVVVRCVIEEDQVTVQVVDQGRGFDPDRLEALPAETDPRRLRHESGLGIPLMRTLADEVAFTPADNGTTVTLVVYRPATTSLGGTARCPSGRGAGIDLALLGEEGADVLIGLLRVRGDLLGPGDVLLVRGVRRAGLAGGVDPLLVVVRDLLERLEGVDV